MEVCFIIDYMNQTKKLTQGAMMLAIIGALILLDRMTAYWFTELIVLMMPVVIIMYATMHTLKDGVMLSVGLLIISFLLGNFRMTYLIYVPVGIFTGMVYSYFITKNKSRRFLMFSAMITYTIGELIASFVVYPLLGFPITQMANEYLEAFNEAKNLTGFDYGAVFASIGLDLGKIIGVLFVMSTILMGIMEGLLIHLISIFLLKKFKIKDLGNTNIYEIKPNPVLGYISLFAVSSSYLITYFKDNEIVYYAILIFSILGAMVLLYYGYIFIILFGSMVLHRNIGGIFILLAFLIPFLFTVLMMLGFLYATGPLRSYLERKVQEQKQIQ